ncbi:glycosyltransferase family 4 protein [Pseudoalteromonas sp. BZB3]|uniref:glycosyltransferase family 4 protein n=1 Tax=Pseudoalteromonas sp. BZB3 TaxID=3136670 RepID=UPI0032C44598
MINKQKILVVTPRFPYPVIGGDRLRIYQICKYLSSKYDLHLVSICEQKEDLDYQVPDDKVFTSIDRYYLPKWKSYLKTAWGVLNFSPLQVAYYKSAGFKKLVDKHIKSADLALCHLVRTAKYIEGHDIPKVLEMTDAISMNYDRVAKISKTSGIMNFIYSVERKRLRAFELGCIDNFDYSVLVSDIDKSYLLPNGGANKDKVIVSSNGVDTDFLSYDFSHNSKTIIFIGNLYSVQNLDAAVWFAEHVMPLLLSKGNYKFKVIGRIKEKDRVKFKNFKGVELTGAVDSIPCEARGSLAAVCPVRLAAGVQNKILEYMSLGVPTITSSIGLEGINAQPGKELLVANKPEEYVAEIEKLYFDEPFSEGISIAARSFVESEHSWDSQLSNIGDVFNSLEIKPVK